MEDTAGAPARTEKGTRYDEPKATLPITVTVHEMMMFISRCKGIGPPSGIPSSGQFFNPNLLSAELRRHPTVLAYWKYPSPLYCLI